MDAKARAVRKSIGKQQNLGALPQDTTYVSEDGVPDYMQCDLRRKPAPGRDPPDAKARGDHCAADPKRVPAGWGLTRSVRHAQADRRLVLLACAGRSEAAQRQTSTDPAASYG